MPITPLAVEEMKRLRQEALTKAKEATERTGRKHVVREDYGKYFICPLYKLGAEGIHHDPGYTGLGILVKESL